MVEDPPVESGTAVNESSAGENKDAINDIVGNDQTKLSFASSEQAEASANSGFASFGSAASARPGPHK